MQQTAKLKLDEQKKMETKRYQTYFVHEETEEAQCYIRTCKKLRLHKHKFVAKCQSKIGSYVVSDRNARAAEFF